MFVLLENKERNESCKTFLPLLFFFFFSFTLLSFCTDLYQNNYDLIYLFYPFITTTTTTTIIIVFACIYLFIYLNSRQTK